MTKKQLENKIKDLEAHLAFSLGKNMGCQIRIEHLEKLITLYNENVLGMLKDIDHEIKEV